MNRTIKLVIAGLAVALASTMGLAAPADAAKSSSITRDHVCC